MKTLFHLLIGLVVTIQLNAQTTTFEGKILNINAPVKIRVFEYQEDNNWHLVKQVKAGDTYILSLRQDKDYQVWFTDTEEFTKVLAVNRQTVQSKFFDLNIDFKITTSVQIFRDESNIYKFVPLDTEFTVLKSPWDLYCI